MTGRARIGIVGLGAMGLGIAQVFAEAGHPVTATDQSAESRESAPERLREGLARRVNRGRMSEAAARDVAEGLEVVPDIGRMSHCALVTEAIIEDMAAKRALLAALDRVVPDNAVLATNTSSLSVAELARATGRPGRVLGLHFFNPAPVMKLVELVAAPGTDALALDRAATLATGAGKTVIRCADRPGFIVNRCARPFYGEALALLEEGRSAVEIDAAMVAAGYRLGPFALIDLVGADINLAATRGLSEAMGGHPRYHVFRSLARQVESGDLGRKSGAGFVHPARTGPPPADAEAVALRIEATLANEAAFLLEEGGTTAEDIDTAMRLGLNFPRGPFEAASRHGADRVLAALAELERTAPPHLEGRYVAARRLGEFLS